MLSFTSEPVKARTIVLEVIALTRAL